MHQSILARHSARARKGSRATLEARHLARWTVGRPQAYFSMSENVLAKVYASPGHLAET